MRGSGSGESSQKAGQKFSEVGPQLLSGPRHLKSAIRFGLPPPHSVIRFGPAPMIRGTSVATPMCEAESDMHESQKQGKYGMLCVVRPRPPQLFFVFGRARLHLITGWLQIYLEIHAEATQTNVLKVKHQKFREAPVFQQNF